MSALLRVDNFSAANVREVAQVQLDIAAGAGSATFVSIQGVADGDIMFIGQLGTEKVERKIVSGVIGNVVSVVGTFGRDYPAGSRITFLRGDQLKIYRAANTNNLQPLDTAFALLAGMPLVIDYDQSATDYQDQSGSSSYWYKSTFFNSGNSDETQLSDSPAVRGGGYGHYCSVDAIRGEAGFKQNPFITDAMISSRRDDAESEVNGELVGMYNIPFTSPIPPVVTNIVRLLAAGWLLAAEYGPVSSGTNKDAKDKLTQARDLIAKIKKREILLVNAIGEPQNISHGVESWPNKDTATAQLAQGGDGGRKFRSGMEF